MNKSLLLYFISKTSFKLASCLCIQVDYSSPKKFRLSWQIFEVRNRLYDIVVVPIQFSLNSTHFCPKSFVHIKINRSFNLDNIQAPYITATSTSDHRTPTNTISLYSWKNTISLYSWIKLVRQSATPNDKKILRWSFGQRRNPLDDREECKFHGQSPKPTVVVITMKTAPKQVKLL